jgi:DNA-binding MarR family transcriptional regulator
MARNPTNARKSFWPPSEDQSPAHVGFEINLVIDAIAAQHGIGETEKRAMHVLYENDSMTRGEVAELLFKDANFVEDALKNAIAAGWATTARDRYRLTDAGRVLFDEANDFTRRRAAAETGIGSEEIRLLISTLGTLQVERSEPAFLEVGTMSQADTLDRMVPATRRGRTAAYLRAIGEGCRDALMIFDLSPMFRGPGRR